MALDFFEELNKADYDCKEKIFNQIRNDWGYSTVVLKDWLNSYYPFRFDDNLIKYNGINADVFLPYRKGKLWFGSIAISRLELAVKTKALIIFNNESKFNDQFVLFKIECLRLWLRIDSTKTKYSLEEFTNMTNKAAKEAIEDQEWLFQYLYEKMRSFKYVKKVYHYKAEDFSDIKPFMTLREAYAYWIKYTYPRLLEYYKDEAYKEFIVFCNEHEVNNSYMQIKYDKLFSQLDNVHIKKPNTRTFAKMLKTNNIKYKKQDK